MNKLSPIVENPRIEDDALVGTSPSGEPLRLPFPVRCRDITVEEAAEALGVTLRQPGDREGWTTAPADYDWGATRWVETVECPSICGGRTKTWRRVLVRSWGSFDNQLDRYASGLHAAQVEDPRAVLARIRERAEAESRAREAERARLEEEEADRQALRAMSLDDLEIEVSRRSNADEDSEEARRARRVRAERIHAALEAAAEAQMAQVRGVLASAGPVVKFKGHLWEYTRVRERAPGASPLSVLVEGYCDQVPGTWEVAWWLKLLDSCETGTFPDFRTRQRLISHGIDPIRVRPMTLGGRAAWVDPHSGAIWQDNLHKIPETSLRRHLAQI